MNIHAFKAALATRLAMLGRLSTWLWLIGMLVLPQLCFWLAGTRVGLQRPVFNLDLIVAAAVLAWRVRWGLLLFVLVLFVDLLRSASLAYHFGTPTELLSTFRFAEFINVGQLLSWPVVAGVMGLVTSLTLLVLLSKRVRRPGWLLLLVAPLLYGADLVNGSSQLFGMGADRAKSSVNIAGSAVWNVYAAWRAASSLSSRPLVPFANPVAYREADAWMREHPDQSVLVVVVESMGLPKAQLVREWLRRQIDTERLNTRWAVQEVAEDFEGSTTRGELRTLCGVNGHYSRLTPVTAADCLPQRAVARGYKAVGLHGFTMSMFDRADWWPRIGLQPWDFGAGAANSPCNDVFPGVCDARVVEQALALVDAPKRFVYALTLDTHLPLPVHPDRLPTSLAQHCRDSLVPETACALVNNLGQVLAGLERGLGGLGSAPLVVIVGDHAPPFVAAASREAFSATQVPLYLLRPR